MGAGMLNAMGAALGNIGGMMYQGAQREEAEQRADARAVASEERAWARDLQKIKMATERALEEKKRQGAAYSTAQGNASKSIDTDREAYVRQALGLPEGTAVTPEMMDEYSPKSQRGMLNRTQDELMKIGETDLAKTVADRADKMGAEEREAKRDQRQEKIDDNTIRHQKFMENIQSKQLSASLAASRDAALDRTERREEKKEKARLYDKLIADVEAANSSDDPSAFQNQINRTLLELRRLGVDETGRIYGTPKRTGEVETTEMTPQGEIKRKTDTYGNTGAMVKTNGSAKPVTGGNLVYDPKTGAFKPKQ